MDETGSLEEGQIYCTFNSNVILGSVIITRSPALHPGDVRVVTAVDAPLDSPLRDLHNVVVFSQNGDRVRCYASHLGRSRLTFVTGLAVYAKWWRSRR